MKKDKVGKKVFVIGSASRLEMDALRKAMEKVGLEKCEMWGCVGSMRRKRRLLVNSANFKNRPSSAPSSPKGNARNVLRFGFARGVVRKIRRQRQRRNHGGCRSLYHRQRRKAMLENSGRICEQRRSCLQRHFFSLSNTGHQGLK